jgi:S1-C subfamily serine protease
MKNLKPFSTHILALLLGGVITFGGLRVLSSKAEPLTDNPNSNLQPVEVAVNPSITHNQNFVASAVQLTGPAVVRIDTERTVVQRVDPFMDDPFFRQFFGDRFNQGFSQERKIEGQGSGFIIDQGGVILTNAHVVSKADKVTVTLKDGRQFQGEVKGTDEITDLAVVKIDTKGQKIPVAPLGNSDNVEVGDWAIAVGNPVGLNNTVTLGIISTLSRSSAEVGIPDKRVEFLQTDAAINPGNSGGPLLNDKGEVIGINTAIRADAMGIGFAIPINKAKELEPILATGKKVPHPYIGVQMRDLTPEIAQKFNQNPNTPLILPEIEAVLVVGVMPNTPAERGGLRSGDVILEVNGKKITKGSQLQQLVETSGINQELKIKVQRGERKLDVTVRTAQLENMTQE